MGRPSEPGPGAMGSSEPEPSWAIGQARYLMSETMQSALRRRPDTDPIRTEVAQVLATLGGKILAQGAQADARRACEAAVAHLRLVRQADREASGDLARALYNLGVVRLEERVSEGRAAAARHASEALRLVVSGPEPGSEADVECSPPSPRWRPRPASSSSTLSWWPTWAPRQTGVRGRPSRPPRSCVRSDSP